MPPRTRDRIRMIRHRLGETREEFARRFVRSPRTVEAWEHGIRQPGPRVKQAIAVLEAAVSKKTA